MGRILLLSLFACGVFSLPDVQRDILERAAKEIQTYDYVIVGGGLTGLVVANRLSEDEAKTVLVIENGNIDDSPPTRVPYLANFVNTDSMYQIQSAPEPYLNNLTFPVRVGNVVGGGSVVNGMQFDRGSNADYDAWEELGNKGWGWSGLEKYFKKTFHFTPPSASAQAKIGLTYDENAYGNGSIHVSIPSYQYSDYKPIFDSWRRENVSTPKEGFANPVGAYWTPNTINNATAERSHARIAYYDPVKARPNLHLLPNTHVDEILFDTINSTLAARGVKITSRLNSSTSEVYASKEVILAAGGVFTPHLLMVSGIGPAEVLNAAKIPVKLDKVSVGSNFQDHVPGYMSFNLTNTSFPNPDTISRNTTFNASAAAQYEEDRSGPWSLGRGNALAMLPFKQFSVRYENITQDIKSQQALAYLPERYSKNNSQSQALYQGFLRQREILIEHYLGEDAGVGEFPISASGRATVSPQKPLSRGTITLNATNPHAHPIVLHNALKNPIDKVILAELVRFNRKHWSSPSLSQFSPIENVPGVEYQTDDEIVDGLLKANSLGPSFSHPSGGCSMMPEALGGCVSEELLVYGTQKLSVVDASIIPLIPATHLQATMYVVAEKASDIIKARA